MKGATESPSRIKEHCKIEGREIQKVFSPEVSSRHEEIWK